MFGGILPRKIEINLPGNEKYKVHNVYDVCNTEIILKDSLLLWKPEQNMSSAAVYLKRCK
jgi:hypothetical protein